MAEPEERLRDEEEKLGSKVVVREEEQEARVRLDSQVDERRESEEGLRMRGGGEEEGRGRGGLDFTRGLISLKQMQEHSFSLVNQVRTTNAMPSAHSFFKHSLKYVQDVQRNRV